MLFDRQVDKLTACHAEWLRYCYIDGVTRSVTGPNKQNEILLPKSCFFNTYRNFAHGSNEIAYKFRAHLLDITC